MTDLHEQIASLLGWTVEQTRSFSLRSLRELLRPLPPTKRRDEALAAIEAEERSGRIVTRRR